MNIIHTSYIGYGVSENGEVFSFKRKKYLKKFLYGKYFHVTLCIKGKRINKSVHRLTGKAWLPNPLNKPFLNHKNGNRLDNHKNNLEWNTVSENVLHAIKNGLFTPPQKNRTDLSLPILKFDLENNFISLYPSANEASRQTGLSQKWISACANGGSYRISGGENKWVNCNTNGGFIWKWQKVKLEITKQ